MRRRSFMVSVSGTSTRRMGSWWVVEVSPPSSLVDAIICGVDDELSNELTTAEEELEIGAAGDIRRWFDCLVVLS